MEMAFRVLTLAVVLLGGCYSPTYPEHYLCPGAQTECPEGFHCVEGKCVIWAGGDTGLVDQGSDSNGDAAKDLGPDLLQKKDQASHDKATPDVKMPDVKMPDVKMPDVKVPDMAVPDLLKPDKGPICGNNKLDAGEPCDGKLLGGKTCKTVGFDGGSLSCKACSLVTSACFKCGDKKKNGVEECDDKDLAGATCFILGFGGGTLTCTKGCKLEKGSCTMAGYVAITPGSFSMGSPSTDACRQANEDHHKVNLTHKFEIMATETNQFSMNKYMAYSPSANSGCHNCPVESLNWHEAAAYCDKGSTVNGLAHCYTCTGAGKTVQCLVNPLYQGAKIYDCPGFRLPTEAEWEYAARAGSTTSTHQGNVTMCGTTCTDSVADAAAWYCGNTSNKPKPAGSKKNAWSITDMNGNVWEWCHDWYKEHLGTVQVTDPAGPTSGTTRTIRGGSWNSPPRGIRAAVRGGPPHTPFTRSDQIGFRCARTLK